MRSICSACFFSFLRIPAFDCFRMDSASSTALAASCWSVHLSRRAAAIMSGMDESVITVRRLAPDRGKIKPICRALPVEKGITKKKRVP